MLDTYELAYAKNQRSIFNLEFLESMGFIGIYLNDFPKLILFSSTNKNKTHLDEKSKKSGNST